MLFLRKIALLLLLALLSSSVLAACETNIPTSVTSTPTPHLLSPEEIASYVGTAYGDPQAQIAGVKSDVTDNPPHDPMYHMTLTGHFHKGTLEAETLGFSALADRMYVWVIYAYDQAGTEVWFDKELAPASP
ncbi:MAG TPA: hypothetical protein VFU32_09970 [Ktedonobacterales bacterium]|nr:hypothetical protein [Ktedonobacterales bacterium]